MLTKFDNIKPVVVDHLRGGVGSCTLYKLENLPVQYKMFAKIVVHPNSSIGYHAHVDDEEIIYVLEGTGKVIIEDETKELLPGMINVCKENHYHSVINDSKEDLVIIGIVTKAV